MEPTLEASALETFDVWQYLGQIEKSDIDGPRAESYHSLALRYAAEGSLEPPPESKEGFTKVVWEPIQPTPEVFSVEDISTWQEDIVEQIYEALCKRSSKYKTGVNELAHNGNVLIGMLAGSVAHTLGIAASIAAALVAALLRLVLRMGIAVFCKRMKEQLG